ASRISPAGACSAVPVAVAGGDVGPAPADPVAQRPVGRLERDAVPRNRLGAERLDLERLGVQAVLAPEHPCLEGDATAGRLEPGVQPDDLARLDDEACLLEGLAD